MTENNSPVFVFSSSWRTGSTLLQRLLNTTEELLVWGEPQFLMPVRRMFNAANRNFSESQWMRDQAKEEKIHELWAPTICPDTKYVVPAFRNFFDSLYGEPSFAQGYTRWGFKEVRDHALENAIMLRGFYPDAKIVFHYRHPFAAYASLKETDFFHFFEENPFRPVHIWARNYASFKTDDAKLLDPFLISHEEIVKAIPGENHEVQQLFDYVGIEMTATCDDVLGKKLGGSADDSRLSDDEKSRIREILQEHGVELDGEYPDV
ncbi:MAG: sulfotransferase [Halioglobus sp.]